MPEAEHITTLEDALRLLRTGEVTAVALAEHYLACIDARDPRVLAFITVTHERALADAAVADARRGTEAERPLDGVPIAVKDIVATRGIRTTAGSRVLAEWVPDTEAAVTRALAAAGTTLLGKTNAHEFAFGAITPPTRNPWDLDRIPGGSSGGSAAAVAAGMCLGAVGTDTGGSIRMPAACCGVTGLKPTYGLVSTDGVVPLSWSLDHIGPIAHSARDCALLLDAMVGGEPFDSLRPVPGFPKVRNVRYADVAMSRSDIAGLKLGVPTNYFFSYIEPEVEGAVREAIRVLAELGADVHEVQVPEAIDDLFAVYLAIQRSEARVVHEDADWFPAKAEQYTPSTRGALERALDVSPADYIRAQRAKQAFEREMDALLRQVDALATPTLPVVAPRLLDLERPLRVAGREERAGPALVRLTFPFNISGQPALTLPCGFSESGLPIGLQLIGARFDEATLLQLACAYQDETDWHLRHPQ